jgi:hypothetical protein
MYRFPARLRRAGTAYTRATAVLLLLIALLTQSTVAVFAATTGGLSGIVTDGSGNPVAGAVVAVNSPSQAAQTRTDAKGSFTFLALSPDTYTVTVQKAPFGQSQQTGVTVTADSTAVSNFRLLATIGKGTALGGGTLVKRGETADVYTVSGQLAQTTQQLGGGGTIGQTYSQLASLPGVYVPQGITSGQNTAGPYVRGGDYNQVGYEFDGIPVNRSFDNYVSNTQGITGQQELQAYTGGVDATSTGQGLSGYINQTIKRGTYPGSGTLEFVGGAPSPYSSGRFEYGQSNEARTFSYYIAETNWQQKYRYGSQFSNTATEIAGNPYSQNFQSTDANGNLLAAPLDMGLPAEIRTNETVANLIFGIPQKNGNRDEIQFLVSVGRQLQYTYDAPTDAGAYLGAVTAGGFTSPYGIPYITNGAPTLINTGKVNAPFSAANTTSYYFPYSGATSIIDPNQRSTQDNNNSIEKLQYQKNFDKGYVRVYGYANFSDWLIKSPATYYYNVLGNNADYELDTHSYGGAFQAGYQLNSNNTLNLNLSYVTANVLRANNTTAGTAGYTAQIKNAAGNCFSTTTGLQTNCYSGSTALNPNATYTAGQTIGATPAAATAAGAQLVLNTTGYSATVNTVTPEFTTFSLEDAINIGTKLKLNAGVRFDNFKYILADTSQQALFGGNQNANFTEYNLEHCTNPTTGGITLATAASGFTCGAGLTHTSITNSYPGQVSSFEFEPRLSGTYTLDPLSVVRFSAGKYSTPIDSAAVQYNRAGDLAAYTATTFGPFGFNSPAHPARPTNSYNFDLSFERQLSTGKLPASVSLTPFYRHAEDQTSTIYLDAKHGFVSSLNVGALYAYGVEALARVGDFNRNGLSGQAAFTYTRNKIVFTQLYGSTQNYIDQINDYIRGNANKGITGYNQLTQAGGGSPCYSAAGAAVACGTVGAVTNPYYNSAPQALFNPQGSYSPFDVLPGGTGSLGFNFANATQSFEIPYVTTLVMQYKHDNFRFSPSLQIDAGQKYGTPFSFYANNPAQPGTAVYIPDPTTGTFDSLGQWFAPTTASISASMAYDLGKTATVTLIATNLYHHCYTHGYAWEQGGTQACSYGNNVFYQGPNGAAGLAGASNQLQGGNFGYAPSYGSTLPINLYASVQFHL